MITRSSNRNRLIYTPKDMPAEASFRWPEPPAKDDPREVVIDVNTWRGTAIGASHYYVKVKEEDNQWWSDEEGCWCVSYRNRRDVQRKFEADVFSLEEAAALAAFIVKTYYADAGWSVRYDVGRRKHECNEALKRAGVTRKIKWD